MRFEREGIVQQRGVAQVVCAAQLGSKKGIQRVRREQAATRAGCTEHYKIHGYI